MTTTINDVYNSTDVLQMYNNARYYAMDNFGVSWADSEKVVAENLPEVQRLKDGNDAGTIDLFGNYTNAPGYNKIDSINNPFGAFNRPELDEPVNVVNTSTPVVDNQVQVSDNPATTVDEILSNNNSGNLTAFGLNELYKEILGRPFTDGDAVASVYLGMTPEDAREYLLAQPEALIYKQGGDDLTLDQRTAFLDMVQQGLPDVQDVNNDGVVNIDDLLIDMGRAGYGENFFPISNVQDSSTINSSNTSGSNANTLTSANNQTGFVGTNFNTTIPYPYVSDTIRMQVTPGSNIMPTTPSQGFFGINPTTNQLGLMQTRPQDLMFRSGVGGFTDKQPTGFEFGIPAVVADVPIFYPEQYQSFLDAKEAEEAEAKKNRYTFSGMGADFDQSRLNETYTDS